MEHYAIPQRAPPPTFHHPADASLSGSSTGRGPTHAVFSPLHRRLPEWHPQYAGSSTATASLEPDLDEAMWRMSLQPQEGVEVPYPLRPGEPDCAYYMRTGLCGFGTNCRFNHPPNRWMVPGLTHDQEEYPERIGQPECQYYLKTGTCKFGVTCKFHHPRDKAGFLGRAQLNVLNLPLRPNERDCAYYMRTGACKFGATCKFNHPEPTAVGAMLPPVFPSGPGGPSGSAPAGLPTWQIPRAAFLPSPRMQSPTFAPMFFPPHQGLVSMWSTYQAPGASLTSRDGQQALGASFFYGPTAATQQEPVGGGFHGSFSPYVQASGGPSMSSPGHRDSPYPSRPGQPECYYYMKTGECKFGSTCRFDHPRDHGVPSSPVAFSPMGLPLHPGVPPCTFYARNGFCKFGPTCKFDHSFISLLRSPSASSFADTPFSVGSQSRNLASTLSSEALRQPSELSSSTDVATFSGKGKIDPLSREENVAQTGKDASLERTSSASSPIAGGTE